MVIIERSVTVCHKTIFLPVVFIQCRTVSNNPAWPSPANVLRTRVFTKAVRTIRTERAYKNRSYFARQSVSQGFWRKDFAVNLIHAQSVGDVVRMEFESLHLYTTVIKRCTHKQRVSLARPALSLRWYTQWAESVRGTWPFPQDLGAHVYLKIIRKEKREKKYSEFVTIALRFARGGTTGEYDRSAGRQTDRPIIPYNHQTGADIKKIVVFPATILFDKSSPSRGVYILFDALVRGESLRNCYISRRVPTRMTHKVEISMYFYAKQRALGEIQTYLTMGHGTYKIIQDVWKQF